MGFFKALFGGGADEEVRELNSGEVQEVEREPEWRIKRRRRFRLSFGPREKIHAMTPTDLKDAQIGADCIKEGTAVFMNLQKIDRRAGQRIVDMMCGVCYALDGQFMRVGDRLFLFVPPDFPVGGDERSIIDANQLFMGGFSSDASTTSVDEIKRWSP